MTDDRMDANAGCAFLIAAVAVIAVSVAGICRAWPQYRARQQAIAECERRGGVYARVVGKEDFACVRPL